MTKGKMSFSQLSGLSIPRVELEGIIMGAIIEEMGQKSGIQFSLGPHVEDHNVSIDKYALVFYPGKFEDSMIRRLMAAKQLGNRTYVVGSYSPKNEGCCVGMIEAEKVEIQPYS